MLHNYHAIQREALYYWELRRLWFNLLLIPPAVLGYGPAEISAAVGDHRELTDLIVAAIFASRLVGANICYCLAYALEFFFASDNPLSAWRRYGRIIVFTLGTLVAIPMTFVNARMIYDMEYPPVRM